MAKDPAHITHQAGPWVNGGRVAKDTSHTTPDSKQAERWTGARWPRTPQMQHNTPSGYTREQEPSGPGPCTHSTPSVHTAEHEPTGQGHRTHNTTHRAGTTGNKSQVAKDIAH